MTAVANAPAEARGPAASSAFSHAEHGLSVLALALLTLLPIAEIVLRRFDSGIPGGTPFVQHLTLVVALVGGALAARDDRLLALATGSLLPAGNIATGAKALAAFIGAAVSALLARAGVDLVRFEREAGRSITEGVPVWAFQVLLPLGFAVITWRIARAAFTSHRVAGAAAIAGAFLGLYLGAGLPFNWAAPFAAVAEQAAQPVLPGGANSYFWWLLALFIGGVAGAPIFALLGGAAAIMFLSEGVPGSAILIQTYQLSTKPTLASIPLFTLVGVLLAEGGAPHRLLRVFRALFGWFPGGTAVVCAMLCAFFTVFTGGSGVTILALGGLLFPALVKDGYGEKFSLGLLTASGSLGLLLPPALPLILYGIVAQTPIEDLFIGGIVPGILLIGMTSAWGIRAALVAKVPRPTFAFAEAGAALWDAKWEIVLPVVIVGALFSGFATTVEAAAIGALYTFFTQVVVHRDLKIGRDIGRVAAECSSTVGGVLLILGVAVGLTSWMIDADVPGRLLELTQQYISSRWAFLLAMNGFLLVVGALMDVFSATFVVAPLLVPLGLAYDIHPVHLGIIFIANLELGYLTPPVGLNLFLASYRFRKPLLEVAAATFPMLLVLGFGVLVITYVPWLTTGLLTWMGRI
ncbi:MAG TPA: TRAP transporter large permease subunit [Vicinamibacterales bacterium]|nr:TRAP transporter large permease subunit [Vicinamibacterales bacterium]